MKKDWVRNLFIEHADLFSKIFIEKRVEQTKNEIYGVLKIFKQTGIEDGATILDLGCGIGRHSVELAKKGYKVMGIDLSPIYIEIARKRAFELNLQNKIQFEIVDERELRKSLSSEKFNGIINMFTSFGFYNDETNKDILSQCKDLVKKDGIFIMEIVNRDWIVRNFQEKSYIHSGDLFLFEENKLDLENSRKKDIWRFFKKQNDESCKLEAEVEIDLRIYCLHELIDLFKRTGWNYLKAYGDLELNEPSINSNRLVVVAKKIN